MSRTAEDWGRIAVSLPGWRWMPGMAVDSGNDQGVVTVVWQTDGEPDDVFVQYDEECPAINITTAGDNWSRPVVDDPATAGCLLALVSTTPSEGYMAHVLPPTSAVTKWRIHMNTAQTGPLSAYGATLGRACIAAAEALGRWPGGAE